MTIENCEVVRPGFPRPVPNIPSNVVDQLKLNDKVAVVTGAADGIGLSVAEGFAEAGAHVVFWYHSNEIAVQKAEEVAKTHGVKTKAYKVDGKLYPDSWFFMGENYIEGGWGLFKTDMEGLYLVSNSEQVEKTISAVVADFGKIDIFVANAGMSISKPILEQTLDEYRKQLSVNVDGNVFCAKYAGAVFQQQGFGNLIITSSMSAHVVNVPVDQPVYNGTKAFLTHFGKSLAREWRDFARVNIVSPGFFATKMGAGPSALHEAYRMAPLGRQGHTKEIKGLYLYLASDASTYMTGSDILIDGGYVLP